MQIFGLCNFVMYCTRRACSTAPTTLMTYMMACAGDGGKTTMAMWAFWFLQNYRRAKSVHRDTMTSKAAVLSLSSIHNLDMKNCIVHLGQRQACVQPVPAIQGERGGDQLLRGP